VFAFDLCVVFIVFVVFFVFILFPATNLVNLQRLGHTQGVTPHQYMSCWRKYVVERWCKHVAAA
jgi:hypothetical protein